MADLATLVVRLVGESKSYNSMLSQATNDAKVFQGGILGSLANVGQGLVAGTFAVLKTAVVGVGVVAGVAGAAMGKFLYDSVKAAQDAQRSQAQLQAVLKSTGGVAGITAGDVNQLSARLSALTGVDDDVLTSAQSMLLTFTDIGKKVFPDAAKAALDMATAMGGGAIPSEETLRNTTVQLGKALQDPDAGLGALKRVGVNTDELSKKFTPLMTKEQKQILILKELSAEFGGSAEAAGKTFAGQMAILQVQMQNAQETIGGALLPVLSSLAQTLNTELAKPATQAFIQSLAQNLAQFAQNVISHFPEVLAWLQGVFGWLGTNLGPVVSDVVKFIGGFIEGIQALSGQGSVIEMLLTGLANGFLSLADINPIFQQIGDALFVVMNALNSFVAYAQQDQGIIVAVLVTIGAALTAFAVQAAIAWIMATGPIILAVAIIGGLAYWIYHVWTTNMGGIQDQTAAMIAWVTQAFQNVMAVIVSIWSNPLLQLTIKTLVTSIQMIIGAFQAAMHGDWTRFGEMLRIVWDNNWCVEISGESECTEWLIQMMETGDKNARWWGECMFGIHPKSNAFGYPTAPVEAYFTGMHSRPDTLHNALGHDAAGTDVVSNRHIDTFVHDQTVYVDGDKIIDKGHLIVLDEPQMREFASRYGDPDQILRLDPMPDGLFKCRRE